MKRRCQFDAATVGFIVAPLVAAAMAAIFSPLAGGSAIGSLGIVAVFYFFAFMASGLLALPAFLLLKRFSLVRWWSALLAGAIIGAVVAVVLALPSMPPFKGLLFFVAVGMSSGISFWVIWRVGKH